MALRIVRRITGRGKVAAVRGVGVISAGTAAPGAEHPAPLRRRLSDWAVLIIPAAAALLLDGYQLGKLSLWRDEAYTVDAAHRGIGQIIALLHRTDAVNGAYYLLMHGVITFFGTSAAVLRLPSLLATAVTAAMIAALGRLLARQANLPAPWLTGLLAGLLFAAAPQAIRYAQDARAYAIVTMLATVATYLLVRAMMVGTWWRWTGYALAIAAAGLFNLFSLLLVVAHGLTVLTARARRRRVAPDVAAAAVTAHGRSTDIVFYIPWNQRILGMGYPGPFRRLRDIALAVSPVASSTLLGTEVSLATWRHRLLDVSRIWLVTSVSHRKLLESADPLDRVELALLSSMRLIGRWHAGSDVLSLYGQRKAR